MPEPPTDRPTASGRVLVVGAGGFLGRAVVRALAEAGHEVRGLVRDAAKGELVRESGGIPFVGDLLDRRALRTAAEGCAAAIHLAAHPSKEEDATRVRVEGARELLGAAREGGIARVVIGSGYWVYPGMPTVITEESPVDPRGESRANYDAERVGLRANSPGSLDVLVVRPGMVYGPGSWFRQLAVSLRSGGYSVAGDGKNHWSFVSLPDTGTAFVQVLSAESPGRSTMWSTEPRHP